MKFNTNFFSFLNRKKLKAKKNIRKEKHTSFIKKHPLKVTNSKWSAIVFISNTKFFISGEKSFFSNLTFSVLFLLTTLSFFSNSEPKSLANSSNSLFPAKISSTDISKNIDGFNPTTVTSLIDDECSAVDSTSRSLAVNLVIDTTIVDVTCFGNNNGSIDLTVTGGVPPYSYTWSNFAMSEDLFGLSGGTYTVTVKDIAGTTITADFIVEEPDILTAVIDSTSDYNSYQVSCFGDSDGIIYASAAGGTPPFSYAWSNGATTATISGLPVGFYGVTITDANDCVSNAGINLSQPSALGGGTVITRYYGGNVLSCYGAIDGEEVVQLYIRDKVASITRPVQELKGFEKINLKASESKVVNFTLGQAELGFYNNQGKYIVENGEFDIMVGGSSAVTIKDSFTLK